MTALSSVLRMKCRHSAETEAAPPLMDKWYVEEVNYITFLM